VAKRKKAASKAGIIAFILLMLALTAGIFYFATRPKFVRYPAFGIDIPENYSIHGIDVSHHQSSIDWNDVKAMQIKKVQIGFSFIKATEGSSTIDSRFRSNWRAAKNAGMIRGAYHFFNPNRSGIEQARSFIEMVKLQKGDLPPVLDVEQVSAVPKTVLQKRVQDWLNVVEDHYKVKPIIYTGAVFYTRFLGEKFDDYPLWVAHYLVKDKPRISRPWTFWQHSELGHVNGITTFVDFNVFNGDSADFRQLLIK
jgi:lysozyme